LPAKRKTAADHLQGDQSAVQWGLTRYSASQQGELADQSLRVLGLARQLHAGGGGLLDALIALARQLVDAFHGLADLFAGGGLLLGRSGDRLHQPGDVAGAGGDLLERLAGLGGFLDACVDLSRAVVYAIHREGGFTLDRLDALSDLIGGDAGAVGELTDLICDDGEAPAVFPSPRRLDRSIERQLAGLIGDVLYDIHDLPDLLGNMARSLGGLGCVAGLARDLGNACRHFRDG
jgi:hypothetical protein